MTVCEHLLQFYDAEEDLVDAVVPYLAAGLAAEEAVLVIASEPHQRSFAHGLRGLEAPYDGAVAAGTYVAVEASEVLRYLRPAEGVAEPAPEDFEATIGRLVTRLAAERPLRVYGEVVALLWNEGEVAAAIALETMWRRLQEREHFTLFCGYPGPPTTARLQAVRRVFGSDSQVLPAISDHEPLEPMTVEAEFTPTLESPRRVRELLRSVLHDLSLDDDLVERGTLAASELAANAVVHARTSFRLLVRSTRSSVWIGVEDDAPLVDRSAVVGRSPHGLALIAALALRWGVRLKTTGKIVWAEIPRGDQS